MKKCPHCGSIVADDAVVCPACHAELDLTASLPRLTGSYCPSCGALVPEGSTNCPKCGMWVESRPAPKRGRRVQATVGDDPAAPDATNELPRFESAVPSEKDLRDPYLREHPVRLRAVFVAAAACVAVVGGAVLLIAHPWDPDAFSIRATAPADTSQAGFPGTVDTLQGQDSKGSGSDTVKSGDETTYEGLSNAYTALGDLSGRLDDSVSELEEKGFSGTAQERQEGQRRAATLGVEISNCISDIQGVDTTSGTYEDEREELLKMGNWLRNRSDIVSSAWSEAASAPDPSSAREEVLSSVRGEASSFGSLFKQAYSSFSIQAPADGSSS